MDLAQVRARLDWERRHLATHGGPIETLPRVTRIAGANGGWHSIVWSAVDETTADAVIDEQIEHYRELGVEVEWKVFAHDRPTDLGERLARRGFEAGPCEAVLVLDLARGPAWIDEIESGHVVRVTTIDQVDQFRGVAEEIFERDSAGTAEELAASLVSERPTQFGYLAVVDGRAVSVGRLYAHSESHFGGLYGGGTLPRYRSAGHYRATVAARCRDAAQRGVRYMLVDALPTSRPILERLGFLHLTDTWPCIWRP